MPDPSVMYVVCRGTFLCPLEPLGPGPLAPAVVVVGRDLLARLDVIRGHQAHDGAEPRVVGHLHELGIWLRGRKKKKRERN